MGRLIDEDLLIDVIKNIQDHMREVNKKPVPVDAREIFTLFIEMVEKQSTAYDLEEVVKQLEAQKAVAFITLANTSDAALDASYRNVIAYLDGAIEIVRNGGAK